MSSEHNGIVYVSSHRADCTAIKNTLKKQRFSATTVKAVGGWLVCVPDDQRARALDVVWGDERPRLSL